MSTEKLAVELNTDLPFTLSAPKPYLMAYAPQHRMLFVRVFEHNEQIVVCWVRQEKPLTKTLQMELESNETISDVIREMMIKRIRYELGLDVDLGKYIEMGRRDRNYRRMLSIHPGFRMAANSNINEAIVLSIISQHLPFPEYVSRVDAFYHKYGKPVPWNDRLYLFPENDIIGNMDVGDWKALHINMGAKYLSQLDADLMEDIETYTYYPIHSRGLKSLVKLPGIGRSTARILMVYAARRYEKSIYTDYLRRIIKEQFDREFKSDVSFDAWLEKIYPVDPALMIHTLLVANLPKMRFDFDFLSEL